MENETEELGEPGEGNEMDKLSEELIRADMS